MLVKWLIGWAEKRQPNIVIKGVGNDAVAAPVPYLTRWHLVRKNDWFNVYLHNFARGDADRELHDHPWANVSIVLRGRYLEEVPAGDWRMYEHGRPTTFLVRESGSIVFRRAGQMHRLHVDQPPCWSLFITGPKVRNWGFYTVRGWQGWRRFYAARYPHLPIAEDA